MSILSFVQPIESVVPAAEDALTMVALALRTIGGLGAMAAMLVLFRPLLTGIWHALLIGIKPRLTIAQRIALQQTQQRKAHAIQTGLEAGPTENSIT